MTETEEKRRHSAAHILAAATLKLFPNAKLGIGPVTETGYYYDFEFPEEIGWDDVKKIEEEMNLLIQQDLEFTQLVVQKEQAFNILLTRGQIYKSELLEEINSETISFYKTGEVFIDLCRGPHVKSTQEIGVVKLTSLTENYWKNDPERPKLQRIHGVAFATLDDLNDYLEKEKTLRERNFKKLAVQQNLALSDDTGLTYTPAGTTLLNTLKKQIVKELWQEHGEEVNIGGKTNLDAYYTELDRLFEMRNRSYRELPKKFFSNNQIALNEPLNIQKKDLYRINTLIYKAYFDQERTKNELQDQIKHLSHLCRNLELDVVAEIYAPSLETQNLELVSEQLTSLGVSQTQIIDANLAQGELKIRFVTKDALGRSWKIANLQLGKTDLQYTNTNGDHAPIYVIQETWILEQLIAYYLEDRAGVLPVWASPIQVTIIPITENQQSYAAQVTKTLLSLGIRTYMDNRPETMQARIRESELKHTPVIIIIGDKEMKANAVSVRLRNQKELGLIALDELQTELQNQGIRFAIA